MFAKFLCEQIVAWPKAKRRLRNAKISAEPHGAKPLVRRSSGEFFCQSLLGQVPRAGEVAGVVVLDGLAGPVHLVAELGEGRVLLFEHVPGAADDLLRALVLVLREGLPVEPVADPLGEPPDDHDDEADDEKPGEQLAAA